MHEARGELMAGTGAPYARFEASANKAKSLRRLSPIEGGGLFHRGQNTLCFIHLLSPGFHPRPADEDAL